MITFITFNQLHINLYNFLVKHGNILKLPWFWTLVTIVLVYAL